MSKEKARLQELYTTIRPQLQRTLGLENIMQVPKIDKIALNIGVKEAVADSRVLDTVMRTLDAIAGQKSVRTVARKSIAGFKIREGMPIGARVTLRGRRAYEFLDKLINLALPKVRDFQGVSVVFDGRGNYNLGVKEWNIFPEADTNAEKVFGLNITIQTTAKTDAQAYELLKSFGMPFRKK
jgi:large subunit ribosomal protein L5